MLAGFLRGEPVELVKGVTVDVEVPADAEIVLEGYVERGDLADEGPFGDHTGFYTPAEQFPVFHVTAITMRRDAIYPSIVVGKPPQEDAWLGKATERIFLPAVRMTVPEIVDYDLPVAGAFHNLVIVSIRKAFPGHARKVMHALWGLGMLSLTKGIVVVDEHVDVHDYAQVMFYAGANVDPKRDIVISDGPLDHLDHAPTLQFVGGKIGIDATAKSPAEGAREWPPEIEMSGEIRELVDRRWAEYGLRRFPRHQTARSGRVRAGCYDVDQPCLRPLESRLTALATQHDDHPHVPGPSLWPVGFAVGVVVLLVGLIVSWLIVGVGAIVALVFAFLWVRDLTAGTRARPRARGRRRRAPPLRPPPRRSCRRPSTRRALPAREVPRALDARPRRRHRRPRLGAGASAS